MSRIKSIPAGGLTEVPVPCPCPGSGSVCDFYSAFGLSPAGLCACLQGFGYLLFLAILFGVRRLVQSVVCLPVVLLGRFISYAVRCADLLNY